MMFSTASLTMISRGHILGQPAPELKPAELAARLGSAQPPLVLDVRQPREFRTGHIRGAEPVPLARLAHLAPDLPRDREVVCICRTGRRSRAAARQLGKAGVRAFNLEGGMLAWYRAGLPADKTTADKEQS
jgi:SulP family sulfate permease